jgi:putative SOS response-associated peptidase YedK
MCTLYRLASRTEEIARLFGAKAETTWTPPASFYPDRAAPLVVEGAAGRRLVEGRWGVPPPPRLGPRPVVNIRNLESPFWRAALANPALRCLVPADSFCEWTDRPDPETGRKRQHFFALGGGTPFAFAGLMRPGAPTEPPRFAFLTCEPNAVVAPIHAKAMPVILRPDQWAPWLAGLPAAAFQAPLAAADLALIA